VLDEDLIHRDGPTEPGMPRITDFAEFSIVGVELSTSIIGLERISASTRTRPITDRPVLRQQDVAIAEVGGLHHRYERRAA
jgi:hypothetical protein